jgi:hypothetical protein
VGAKACHFWTIDVLPEVNADVDPEKDIVE